MFPLSELDPPQVKLDDMAEHSCILASNMYHLARNSNVVSGR